MVRVGRRAARRHPEAAKRASSSSRLRCLPQDAHALVVGPVMQNPPEQVVVRRRD